MVTPLTFSIRISSYKASLVMQSAFGFERTQKMNESTALGVELKVQIYRNNIKLSAFH